MTQQEILKKYQDFKNKNWLKGLNFDSKFGNQCMDVYRFYCKHLGYTQSPGVRGAKDVANTYIPSDFTKIINRPWTVPQPGDIIIWNGNFGHIAICDDSMKPTVFKFRAFGQNWFEGGTKKDGKGVCVITEHSYKNVICYLRPKR